MSIYVQVTIILLSVIVVLSVLIAYIIRQTLNVKKEYERQLQSQTQSKELWINRHESVLTTETTSLRQAEEQSVVDVEHGGEQMVTFVKQKQVNSEPAPMHSLPANGSAGYHEPHSNPHLEDDNELSEYCVPNCESTPTSP